MAKDANGENISFQYHFLCFLRVYPSLKKINCTAIFHTNVTGEENFTIFRELVWTILKIKKSDATFI